MKDGLKKESVLGRKITSQRFEDQTLFRFEEYERKRKDRLLVQKKEMMKCELDKYTLTPRINKKNGNERSRNPLVSRLDDILQDRKIKIDNKRSKFVSKAEEELKECTFTPKIKSKYSFVT